MFTEFASSFTGKALARGIELKCIGTGTWKVPDPFISERHIEAWRISRENEIRNNQFNRTVLENNTRTQEMLRLIRDVPLQARFSAANQSSNPQDIIESLLSDYREQLIQARDSFRNAQEPVPQGIRTAITRIDRVLRLWIFIGQEAPGRTPPLDDNLPTLPEIRELFEYLVRLYNNDRAAAQQAVDNEAALAPGDSDARWIPRAIARRYIQINRPPGFRT